MSLCARVAALIGLALTLVLAPAAMAAASPSGSAPTASLQIGLNQCGILVTTSFADQPLRIRHVASDGTLKARYSADMAGGPFLITCTRPVIRVGDRLQLFRGSATKPFRTFTVPTLNVTIDRVSDVIRGTATGGVDSISLLVGRCDAALRDCPALGAPTTVPVDPATKTYRDERTEDVTGRWTVIAQWAKGADQVALVQQAPRLEVTPGSAVIRGYGQAPGSSVNVSLKRGQQTGTGSTTAGAAAAFRLTLKRNGAPMTVRAGDVLSSGIASNARMTVPVGELYWTDSSIDGQCFPSGDVLVTIWGSDGGFIKSLPTTAGIDGSWFILEPPVIGTRLDAWCANAKGDAILQTLVVK